MSPKIIFRGDIKRAQNIAPRAQWFLDKIKTEMSFNNLSQLTRTWPLPSGDTIRIQSFFGQDIITIESPFIDIAEVIEEEIVYPLIMRFRFRGTDAKRYYLFWNADEDILYDLIDKDSGEPVSQPISEDDLDEQVIGDNDIVNGTYLRLQSMLRSEEVPSTDWEQTSGGVPSLKKILLFVVGTNTPWLGGSKTLQEIDPDKLVPAVGTPYEDIAVTLYIDGDRTYIVLSTFMLPDQFGTERWYARLLSYDFDLNGFEPGFYDPHTNEIYTYTKTSDTEKGHHEYYVSHAKYIYALPNLPDDVRGFWATKDVKMDLYPFLPDERTVGDIVGNIANPFSGDPKLFFKKSFDVYKTYPSGGGFWAFRVPLEIPNFWVDNETKAITNEGVAIIFEQYIIEEVFEWNGSPFHEAAPLYDIHTDPTYDITGRVWVQRDVEKIEDTDKIGEEAYNYQWNDFKEINFSITDTGSILDMIKTHPMYKTPERIDSYMLIQ